MSKSDQVKSLILNKWDAIKQNNSQKQPIDIFSTIPGEDLEFAYSDLKDFFVHDSINTMVFINSDFLGKLIDPTLDFKTNLANLLFNERFKSHLNEENLNLYENLKKQFLEIIMDLETKWNANLSKIELLMKEYAKLLNISEDESEKVDSEEINTNSVKSNEYYTTLNPTHRKLSYFIFSFYTIIERYTNSILKISINYIPDDQMFDLFSNTKLTDISTPMAKIKSVKKNYKKYDPLIMNTFEAMLKELQISIHQEALIKLKELRDKIGHKEEFLKIEKILDENAFTYFVTKAKKRIDKEFEKIKELNNSPLFEIFTSFINKLEYIFLIEEVTQEIINYLALFDYVLSLYDEFDEEGEEGDNE